MAPEQARGEIDRLDQRSDVYSLGVIFYRILTRRSYLDGKDVKTILELVQVQDPVPPHRLKVGHSRVPRELSAICLKALAKSQENRYQSVKELLADLDRYERGLSVSVFKPSSMTRFLMFCRRHPIPSMSVATAVGLFLFLLAANSFVRMQRYQYMLASARVYKAEGDAAFGQAMGLFDQLTAVRSRRRAKEPSPPEMELGRRHAAMQKRGQSNYDISRLLYAQTVELTKTPILDQLRFFRPRRPDGGRWRVSEQRLLPICQDIVDSYRRQIDCALVVEDYAEARRLFELMDPWVRITPGGLDFPFHLWRANVQRRLEGFGTLEITADRPEAALRLYHLRDDLAVPDLSRPDQRVGADLGVGALQPGSYLLLVDAPECPEVVASFHIGHAEERRLAIHIPERIPQGMVYVPAGSAILGGPQSPVYRWKEVEVPGFFIKQFEVTFAEYLEFWRQETDPQLREVLTAHVQFEEDDVSRTPAWTEAGELLPPLDPAFPVVGIGRPAAEAFCRWRSQREGREVRLPTADEWEKAARGADGRTYPWGNAFRWDCAHLELTVDGKPNRLHAKPGSYPLDRSVYGVFDLGGNVREWTSTPFPDSARRYQIKGGSLTTGPQQAASAHAGSGIAVPTDVGFRYVMPLQPGE
jgi:formylglycine-generating enzyme required for sulfatase activity